MADASFYFPLAIRVRDAARQSHGAVMLQHVTVEGIERGIVDVGCEHAFAQIIEHDYARHASEPAEGFLVQLGPSCELERNTIRRTDLRL